MEIFLVAVVIGLIAAFATDGFTSFVFFGWGNRHRYCEKCGRRVKEVANSYNPVTSCLTGYEKTNQCVKCRHTQKAYCHTYD